MILNGAEVLIETLLDHGVDTIFGYPGGSVLNIYDALYKYKDRINHILTAHEQGAAHAADGYARSTGKVGVCLATSGPGATNLVTGIATAYMDSIPMVAITGNVSKSLLGKDSFQEIDITGITMPITKHNYIVKDIRDLQDTIREAFRIATTGRKGPVLVDVPKNITVENVEYISKEPLKVEKKVKYITEEALSRVATLINKSNKPFIYAGGGVISAEATEELQELSLKIKAPTATSLMGLGAMSSDNEFFTGMIGMHGTERSNMLAVESDLIIAIGTRFSDRVLNSRQHVYNTKIIHIDIDPAEINKNIKVDSYIVGDIKETLERLIPLLNNKEKWNYESGSKDVKKYNINFKKPNKRIFNELNNITTDDSIIVTDVGQHQMWTASYYNFKKPRTFITSGGLGTMGFGVGAAVGAQIVNKDKKVILITGDGSFGMNCNELATIVSNKLPIKIIVINNNSLGMVRQWQNLFYEKRYYQTTLNRSTDFIKLAEAFGIKGLRIDSNEDFSEILKEAINNDEAMIIEYKIHEDLNVFPMVPPGEALDKIMFDEE